MVVLEWRVRVRLVAAELSGNTSLFSMICTVVVIILAAVSAGSTRPLDNKCDRCINITTSLVAECSFFSCLSVLDVFLKNVEEDIIGVTLVSFRRKRGGGWSSLFHLFLFYQTPDSRMLQNF